MNNKECKVIVELRTVLLTPDAIRYIAFETSSNCTGDPVESMNLRDGLAFVVDLDENLASLGSMTKPLRLGGSAFPSIRENIFRCEFVRYDAIK
jgi:hypothetical protein